MPAITPPLEAFQNQANRLAITEETGFTPLRVAGANDVRGIGCLRQAFTFRSTYLAATNAFLSALKTQYGDDIANMMKGLLTPELNGRKPKPLTAGRVVSIINLADTVKTRLADFERGARAGSDFPVVPNLDQALDHWIAAHPVSASLSGLSPDTRAEVKAEIMANLRHGALDLAAWEITDAATMQRLFQEVSEGRVPPLAEGTMKMEILAKELLNQDALRAAFQALPASPDAEGQAADDADDPMMDLRDAVQMLSDADRPNLSHADAARLATEVRARVSEGSCGLLRLPEPYDSCQELCMRLREDVLTDYQAMLRMINDPALPTEAQARLRAQLFTTPGAPAPSRLRSLEEVTHMKQVMVFEYGVDPDNSLDKALSDWFAQHPAGTLTEEGKVALKKTLVAQLGNAATYPNLEAMAAAVREGRLSPMATVMARLEEIVPRATIAKGIRDMLRHDAELARQLSDERRSLLVNEVWARLTEKTQGGTVDFESENSSVSVDLRRDYIIEKTLNDYRDRLLAIEKSRLASAERKAELTARLLSPEGRLIKEDEFARLIEVAGFDEGWHNGKTLDQALAAWTAAHPLRPEDKDKVRAQVRDDLFAATALHGTDDLDAAVRSGEGLPMGRRLAAMNAAAASVLSIEAIRETLKNPPYGLTGAAEDVLHGMAEEVRLRCSEETQGFTNPRAGTGENWTDRLTRLRASMLAEVKALQEESLKLPTTEVSIFTERDGRARLRTIAELRSAAAASAQLAAASAQPAAGSEPPAAASEPPAVASEPPAAVSAQPAASAPPAALNPETVDFLARFRAESAGENETFMTAMNAAFAAAKLELKPGTATPTIRLSPDPEAWMPVSPKVLERLRQRAAASIERQGQANPGLTPEDAQRLLQETLTTWASDLSALFSTGPAALRLHWATRACNDPLFGGAAYVQTLKDKIPALPGEAFASLGALRAESERADAFPKILKFCNDALAHAIQANNQMPADRWLAETTAQYFGDIVTVACAKALMPETGEPALPRAAQATLFAALDGAVGKGFRMQVRTDTGDGPTGSNGDTYSYLNPLMLSLQALYRSLGLEQGREVEKLRVGFNDFLKARPGDALETRSERQQRGQAWGDFRKYFDSHRAQPTA